MEEMPAMITAADLQRFGISRPIAYQLINRPDMPTVKIGRRMFIPKDKFLSWLDENCKTKSSI